MEANTKFSLGDKVFVLQGGKAKQIEVKSVVISEDGVGYSENAGSIICYIFPEGQCFATKDELIKHILSDE